jgi:ABC-type dipeptide/oligopeptide/nickel transport system permease component
MDWDSVTGILAIIMIFGMPVFIVGIIFLFIFRSNAEKQKTLRMAIEKSDSLPPEFLDSLKSLQKKPRTAANDMRAGLILIAIALGLVALDAVTHN